MIVIVLPLLCGCLSIHDGGYLAHDALYYDQGKRIVCESLAREAVSLYVMNADGSSPELVTDHGGGKLHLLPDGSLLAIENVYRLLLVDLNKRSVSAYGTEVIQAGDRILALSPDFKKVLAYRYEGPSKSLHYYLVGLDSSERHSLPSVDQVGSAYPSFTPDNRELVFGDNKRVCILDLNSGALRDLSDAQQFIFRAEPRYEIQNVIVSPDNKLLAIETKYNLYSVRKDGGGCTLLFNGAKLSGINGHAYQLCFSPDSTKIAFVFLGACVDGGIWVVNSDGSQARHVSGLLPWGTLAFSPDGTKLLCDLYVGGKSRRVLHEIDVNTGTVRALFPLESGASRSNLQIAK